MPILALLPRLGPAPDLIDLLSVIDEPLREIQQVVGPVVGVLFESVLAVRQLAVANRFIIDEQFELLFVLGRTYPLFAAFARTQFDVMPPIFVSFWFHPEAPPDRCLGPVSRYTFPDDQRKGCQLWPEICSMPSAISLAPLKPLWPVGRLGCLA